MKYKCHFLNQHQKLYYISKAQSNTFSYRHSNFVLFRSKLVLNPQVRLFENNFWGYNICRFSRTLTVKGDTYLSCHKGDPKGQQDDKPKMFLGYWDLFKGNKRGWSPIQKRPFLWGGPSFPLAKTINVLTLKATKVQKKDYRVSQHVWDRLNTIF